MINPTKTDYINDLTYDNNCMFAQNFVIKEKVKESEHELLKLLSSKFKDETNQRIFQLIGLIQRLYGNLRYNNQKISENLNKIRGLRNGTIEEI